MSQFQNNFEQKLRQAIIPQKLTLMCEHQNPKATTILFKNGRKHIADFYIPELNLYIEISGNNYLPKLLKMKRAHHMLELQYYAIIDITYSEFNLPSAEIQQQELFAFLESSKFPKEGFSKFSVKKLDALIQCFNQLYYEEGETQ